MRTSTPNFLAYRSANTVSVNAQPCRPALNDTVPFSGYTCDTKAQSRLRAKLASDKLSPRHDLHAFHTCGVDSGVAPFHPIN